MHNDSWQMTLYSISKYSISHVNWQGFGKCQSNLNKAESMQCKCAVGFQGSHGFKLEMKTTAIWLMPFLIEQISEMESSRKSIIHLDQTLLHPVNNTERFSTAKIVNKIYILGLTLQVFVLHLSVWKLPEKFFVRLQPFNNEKLPFHIFSLPNFLVSR